jgi:hypothetical protein
MSAPLSFQIAQALQSRLETILTANGYRTEAGQDVALGWRHQDSAFPLPNLTLVETSYQILSDAKRGGNIRVQIEWTVEGLMEIGSSALETLYAIEADILRAVHTPNPDLDGLIRSLRYSGRTLLGPQEGSRLTAIQIRLQSEHAEQLP